MRLAGILLHSRYRLSDSTECAMGLLVDNEIKGSIVMNLPPLAAVPDTMPPLPAYWPSFFFFQAFLESRFNMLLTLSTV